MHPYNPQFIFLLVQIPQVLQYSCFIMQISITVSSPTTFGHQRMSHATSAFPLTCVSPFHRNLLHVISILFRTCFGSRKICDQKACIDISTLFTNCNLPAYDKNLTVRVVILPIILSISGWHYPTDNFLELKGTPMYLKGSSPLTEPVFCRITCCISADTPPKYTQLLA